MLVYLTNSYHNIGHHLSSKLFYADDALLHAVIHIVLIVAPLLIIIKILLVSYRAVRTYRSAQAQSDQPADKGSYHQLPSHIFSFIVRYTLKSQFLLSVGALTTVPITYASLELPKRIINGALQSETFMKSEIALTATQIEYLLILCGLYFLVLLLNSILKFVLNYYKGSVAEGLVRRIRLYILRNESRSSSKKDSDSIVPILINEVEPVCGFSGDSFAVPLLQGGIAVTILVFMSLQNYALSAAALTMLPIQIFIIPKFQRRINNLVRQRVQLIRRLSGVLDYEVKVKKSSAKARSIISSIQSIRLRLFKIKFMMKSLNNFIMNLTPFFFYLIGGYMVIEGQLSLGALVAVLASYQSLSSSIRELFTYYQSLQDAKIRYQEIIRNLALVDNDYLPMTDTGNTDLALI